MLTIFYVHYRRSCPQNLNHWLLEKSEMINLLILKKIHSVFEVYIVFYEKNVLSNVCFGFFGADAILAHAKAWDLVQAFDDPSICFNFLYFHRNVNTFKTH